MKFNVNSYHFKLLRDYERLAVFKEAIDEFAEDRLAIDDCNKGSLAIDESYDSGLAIDNFDKNKSNIPLDQSNLNLAYDLGCGSGVLSYFAAKYFNKIISIEIDSKTSALAEENLKSFDNIEIVNEDVLNFDFSKHEKADLIICEMLDTALIDEEEVPVLNHARKFLKENGSIIPQGIINSAEPVFMNNHYLQYEDDEYSPIYSILGKSLIYSEFDFMNEIDEDFSCIIEFEIKNIVKDERLDKFNHDEDKILLNGIKLTSFTKLNENIICGPSPMLNPAMLIPLDETEVKIGDTVKVRLSYVMGGGVESISTEVIEIDSQ